MFNSSCVNTFVPNVTGTTFWVSIVATLVRDNGSQLHPLRPVSHFIFEKEIIHGSILYLTHHERLPFFRDNYILMFHMFLVRHSIKSHS